MCGVPREQFQDVCEAWTANSGPDRTTALIYSVGWTQHSVGAQYIRAGSIVQLLLGNIGRPGGGVLALRGHASIQGCTDIPTLFNLLPGYLPMPTPAIADLASYVDSIRSRKQKGFWYNADTYMVSLLKEYWGDKASAENDFCYDYLPRIDGDHGVYRTTMDMVDGKVPGYFVFGQNPAVGMANGRLTRLALAQLEWLVVRDLAMIETATFWKSGPEVETGEIVPESCKTEVFFFPAASHVEKEGTFTQTERMLQWREMAVEPSATSARSCGSPTTWAGCCGNGWPTPPTSATGRCWTCTGTCPCTATRYGVSRTRRRCCGGSTGTTSTPASWWATTGSFGPTAARRPVAGSTPGCSAAG